MKRKIAAAAAMVLALVMTAGACAKQSEQVTFTGNTSEEPEYQACLTPVTPSAYGDVRGLKMEPGSYISIIGKSEGTAFWRAVRNGVQQAAEDLNAELGYTGSDKVKVTYNAPAKTEDIDEQVNILDEELSRYPDVIGIASIDEGACTVQFDLATENGIPIIALDSGNLYPGIQCTVKTDNQEAARTGAYKLADEIGKKGDVMVLAHDSKSETAKERVKSFQDEITESHPDVNVAEVVYCDALDDIKKQMADEQNAGLEEGERKAEKESFSDADAVQYMIEQHPGLKGIFATNDGATMLGLEAIRQAEKAKEEGEKEGEAQNGKPAGQGVHNDEAVSKPGQPEDSDEDDEAAAERETPSGEGAMKPKTSDDKAAAEPEISDGDDKAAAEPETSDGDDKAAAEPETLEGEPAAERETQEVDASSGQNAQNGGADTGDTEQKTDGTESAENDENTDKNKKTEKNSETAADNETERSGGMKGNTFIEENDGIILMGFDVSKEQLKALEEGEISGLVVQNPFGIGYASVVAAARTVLQAGNEAQVSTGYLWVTKDNVNEESIRKMLYE